MPKEEVKKTDDEEIEEVIEEKVEETDETKLSAEEEEAGEEGVTVEALQAELEKAKQSSYYWRGEHKEEKRKRQALQQKPDETPVSTGGKLEGIDTLEKYHEFQKKEFLNLLDKRDADKADVEKENRRLYSRLEKSQVGARKRHDDYDDVINQIVVPMLDDGRIKLDLFSDDEDPAESAYNFSLNKLGRTPQVGKNVIEKIKQVENKARTLTKSGAKPTTKTDKGAEVDAMSHAQVEKDIEKLIGRTQ